MSIVKRKNISSLTKLEAEKQSKLIAGEMEEELNATGQESDTKAVKWVKEKGKEEEHKDREKLAEAEWKATDESKKGKVFSYRDVLINYMMKEMVSYYRLLPTNFIWYPVKDSKQGIVLWIRDSKEKWYARGMTVSMVPKYDLNCIERLVVKALDHMDDLEVKYELELKALKELKKSAKTL